VIDGRLRHLRENVLSREELGESVWPPVLAVCGTAALYATLPTRFVAGSSAGVFGAIRWIVPALALLLLAPLLLSTPQLARLLSLSDRVASLHVGRRILAIAVIAVMTAANAVSIVLLVHLLLHGVATQASLLLRAGIHMWAMNVLIFGLWYWQLDAGGPRARKAGEGVSDFLFPQQAMPEIARGGWHPSFIDYAYVSFTNATAFSPTDTMPLSRWAKLLMAGQSAASLLLAVMVVARAINILR
jgi:uncharacterized membrane protein